MIKVPLKQDGSHRTSPWQCTERMHIREWIILHWKSCTLITTLTLTRRLSNGQYSYLRTARSNRYNNRQSDQATNPTQQESQARATRPRAVHYVSAYCVNWAPIVPYGCVCFKCTVYCFAQDVLGRRITGPYEILIQSDDATWRLLRHPVQS